MSKRSGLSRWEDLKRGFVDVGRYRYILHKFDMEIWRDKTCPICEQPFTEEPRFKFMAYDMHIECTFTPEYEAWMREWYEKENQAWEDDYILADAEARLDQMLPFGGFGSDETERDCGS